MQSIGVLIEERGPGAAYGHLLPQGEKGREESCLLIPQLLLQPRHRDAVAGPLIGALVVVVAGLALHPVPPHLSGPQRRPRPLPPLDVLYRLPGRPPPG